MVEVAVDTGQGDERLVVQTGEYLALEFEREALEVEAKRGRDVHRSV